ncbi:membrane metallo-endopeptidase-like 1 isoform X3 [Acanthaster planci]|uniref:Membrane metallo-endopeptidase-like 1 isoform X3 n=1 Tax=Acanthaster planci TaxID=133434 RepID=A0A8B7YAR1_ACAPL|nr:membrane metallo-endopeptidase-like 1 isoform X3 [Acanthaster planci]
MMHPPKEAWVPPQTEMDGVTQDSRTDPDAQLVVGVGVTSKTLCKILFTGILATATVALTVTTVVFVVQRNDIANELNELKDTPICITKQCYESAYVYLSSMDQSINPCDNFFEYACGGWTERYSVPEDRIGFSVIHLVNDDLVGKLKDLFEKNPSAGEPKSYHIVRNVYKSCKDMDTINKLGAKPLTDLLTSLGGWPVLGDNPVGGNWNQSAFDFEKLWADIRGKYDVEMIVATGTWPDPSNKDKYKLRAYTPRFEVPRTELENTDLQEGKSLIYEGGEPDDDGVKILLEERYSEKRQAYFQYLIDIAVALGANDTVAMHDMKDLIEFETTMANMTVLHPDEGWVETTLEEIGMDEIDWVHFYNRMLPASVEPGVTEDEAIVNYRPNYISNVTLWLKDQEERVKANYMIWRLVSRMVPFMNETFLAIRQKYLHSVKNTTTTTDRWKTCVSTANHQYRFISGRMYVDEHFPEDAKQKALEMIRNLQAAFKSMLETNDWLQDEDKPKAAEKADVMAFEIGYPEWIKDNAKLDEEYVGLTTEDDEYFQNNLKYLEWVSQAELALLREDVDTENSLWSTYGPAVVNAFYHREGNGMLFPAGILQPPFYHKDLPWYSNYGGIGSVIGHEITHGFDNDGRMFDKDGILRQWWTQESIDNFKEKAQCIIDQYSGFVMPENGRHLNGTKTQGENIADAGGLREAYKAYIDNIPKQPRLPGVDFTEEQMFFLSFSQLSCSVLKPEGVDYYIDFGVHSPRRYRVIGPLQNNEAFNAAFNCPAGSYMNPDVKCKVWY